MSTTTDYRFLDEAWVKQDKDGSLRLGAVLDCLEHASVESVALPRTGDVVYKGLPLAAVGVQGEAQRIVPSPVTGRVVEVHEALVENPAPICEDPCREGWIARIEGQHVDPQGCRTRKVVLAGTDHGGPQPWRDRLGRLGCKVCSATTVQGILDALGEGELAIVMIDAPSFGDNGPEIVERVRQSFPETRVIVLADHDSAHELAYRTRGVFYYGARPVADMEMMDILFSAFRHRDRRLPEDSESNFLPKWISRINITNHHGQKVSLLAFGDLLVHHKGLGLLLIRTILARAYPVETTRGLQPIAPDGSLPLTEIVDETNQCDRVLILVAEETGRIPGCLTIRAAGDQLSTLGQARQKVTVLAVQPTGPVSGPLVFDTRTTEWLAEHILGQMTSD